VPVANELKKHFGVRSVWLARMSLWGTVENKER
jgi:hypothetical protein